VDMRSYVSYFDRNSRTLEEVKKKIAADYEVSDIHRYSSALDNITSFIKSQAFLYNEEANHCRFRLNLLMLPCIFLSSLCTVFSSVSGRYQYGGFFIAIINAIIAFLLAIVNYLKLDAASEAHHITSNNFLKLKIILEFSSGEVLLFQHPLLQLDGIEKKIEIWDKAYNTGDEDRKKYIQELYKERDDIVNDVWHTVYNFMGLSTDVFLRNVKSCDEVMSEELGEHKQNKSELTERCWKGYTQKGMKTMFGKRYPNCVKIKK
jgi:hypothetical protein